jgi:hypothetical protein
VIVLLVIGGLIAILAWVTVYAITDAWRQASRVCDAILSGTSREERPARSLAGDDLIPTIGKPEKWTALDDVQLARFMNDATSR